MELPFTEFENNRRETQERLAKRIRAELALRRTMQTASGLMVDPFNLRKDDVRIEDLAHALGNLCRFGGHVRSFYSVGQHSVLVAQAVQARIASGLAPQPGTPTAAREVIRWGLIHDASEAYFGDMIWPLKTNPMFEEYKAAEGAAARRIATLLLGAQPDTRALLLVDWADRAVLLAEGRDLLPDGGAYLAGRVAPGEHLSPWPSAPITPWVPEVATLNFLALWAQLGGTA